MDKADWPPGLEEAIAPLWHEPYGDRQNEIVVIGKVVMFDNLRRISDD